MKNFIKNIVRQSFDLHYHIGPEIIPRKYTRVIDLIKNAEGKLSGIALKNHFYPTSQLIVKSNKLTIIGSITLNNSVGGLNPEAIYAASLISDLPIIVWFPTISSNNFLEKTGYEIPYEWVNQKQFKARSSKIVKGISIIKKNRLNDSVLPVLKMIKKTNSILATGHISSLESKILVNKALDMSIKKIIITHPIYQKIDMDIKDQILLAKRGCHIESCFSMYSIDKIPIAKIANQIKQVGYKNIILTSDVGQKFSPDPQTALYEFALLLYKQGVTLKMIEQMLVINPKELIFG